MQLTYYEWFSYELANACYKLNPTEENEKRLREIKKTMKQKNVNLG